MLLYLFGALMTLFPALITPFPVYIIPSIEEPKVLNNIPRHPPYSLFFVFYCFFPSINMHEFSSDLVIQIISSISSFLFVLSQLPLSFLLLLLAQTFFFK